MSRSRRPSSPGGSATSGHSPARAPPGSFPGRPATSTTPTRSWPRSGPRWSPTGPASTPCSSPPSTAAGTSGPGWRPPAGATHPPAQGRDHGLAPSPCCRHSGRMTQTPAPPVPQPLQRWWIAIIVYVVAGVAWIVVSDLLLFEVQDAPRWWSVAKGSGYVLVTAVIAALVLQVVRCRLRSTLAALSAREEELRLLGANARDLLYRIELRPEMRCAFVSDSAERLVGYTPQEHYDDPTLGLKLVHPDEDRKSTRLNSSHSGESRMP